MAPNPKLLTLSSELFHGIAHTTARAPKTASTSSPIPTTSSIYRSGSAMLRWRNRAPSNRRAPSTPALPRTGVPRRSSLRQLSFPRFPSGSISSSESRWGKPSRRHFYRRYPRPPYQSNEASPPGLSFVFIFAPPPLALTLTPTPLLLHAGLTSYPTGYGHHCTLYQIFVLQ